MTLVVQDESMASPLRKSTNLGHTDSSGPFGRADKAVNFKPANTGSLPGEAIIYDLKLQPSGLAWKCILAIIVGILAHGTKWAVAVTQFNESNARRCTNTKNNA